MKWQDALELARVVLLVVLVVSLALGGSARDAALQVLAVVVATRCGS